MFATPGYPVRWNMTFLLNTDTEFSFSVSQGSPIERELERVMGT